MEKLENKVALIAGGKGGIGLATAREFVAERAFVFIGARRQQALDGALARIGRNVTAALGQGFESRGPGPPPNLPGRQRGLRILLAVVGKRAQRASFSSAVVHLYDSRAKLRWR